MEGNWKISRSSEEAPPVVGMLVKEVEQEIALWLSQVQQCWMESGPSEWMKSKRRINVAYRVLYSEINVNKRASLL